ncbi:MAG: ElyC/SanA/YdcF family protein, partial [Akkermansiaceae bacterium]|nr:ElyC/SanA/YdcF family protein [Akkermansiaceae bacterium]
MKVPPVHAWPRWLKLGLLALFGLMQVLVLAPALVVAYANLAPVWVAKGLIYDDLAEVPEFKVALVLGTTDRIGGRENLYFRYRIEAAEELWKSGKVQTLIVSGDNSSLYYNEPLKMKAALVERGIPEDRIVCDYAGLRTLDSVVRAKRIFGTERVLFVSQPFHIRRAIYLAQANGIEAHGFAARDVKTAAGFRTRVREVGAR